VSLPVSIVIPSFEQGVFLEEALVSVLDQDYPALEVLVVDGGSTDGSVEIIERYADRLGWGTSEPDRGQADALNKGFARARGELLGWLSSDDTLLAGTISRLVERFQADPELVLVYGDALFTDERGERTGYLPSRPFDVPQMVRTCECHVVQPGSLFRRRAWEAAGPFDPTRDWFFDFELFVHMAEVGRVERIPEPLATYRLHGESKSYGRPLPRARDYVRVAEEFFTNGLFAGELAGLEDEARASAYYHAGISYYEALELGDARRCFLRSFRLDPAARKLPLLARTLAPAPVIARLRRA